MDFGLWGFNIEKINILKTNIHETRIAALSTYLSGYTMFQQPKCFSIFPYFQNFLKHTT